jgi:hypothetical protein
MTQSGLQCCAAHTGSTQPASMGHVCLTTGEAGQVGESPTNMWQLQAILNFEPQHVPA